jgi:hypothetical protein
MQSSGTGWHPISTSISLGDNSIAQAEEGGFCGGFSGQSEHLAPSSGVRKLTKFFPFVGMLVPKRGSLFSKQLK